MLQVLAFLFELPVWRCGRGADGTGACTLHIHGAHWQDSDPTRATVTQARVPCTGTKGMRSRDVGFEFPRAPPGRAGGAGGGPARPGCHSGGRGGGRFTRRCSCTMGTHWHRDVQATPANVKDAKSAELGFSCRAQDGHEGR